MTPVTVAEARTSRLTDLRNVRIARSDERTSAAQHSPIRGSARFKVGGRALQRVWSQCPTASRRIR